jgi:hypothetical protein
MLKYYTILALSIVGNVATSSAAQPMHEQPQHDVLPKSHTREEHRPMSASKQTGSSSNQQIEIDFNEFHGKDPYELDEKHQSLFRKQQFNEAAKALIGSAMNGDSDNMDYVLRLDPMANQHIAKNDLESTRNLVKRIAEDLSKQFKVSQRKVDLPRTPFAFDIKEEAVSKKEH